MDNLEGERNKQIKQTMKHVSPKRFSKGPSTFIHFSKDDSQRGLTVDLKDPLLTSATQAGSRFWY